MTVGMFFVGWRLPELHTQQDGNVGTQIRQAVYRIGNHGLAGSDYSQYELQNRQDDVDHHPDQGDLFDLENMISSIFFHALSHFQYGITTVLIKKGFILFHFPMSAKRVII
jgi:hypothetical protein